MMKLYFILFLLFIFLGNAQTINKKEDSLISLLKSTTNPDKKISLGESLLLKDGHSDRFKAHVNRIIGMAFMIKGNSKTAVKYIQKALVFSEKTQDDACKALVNCNMGEVYGFLGLASESEEYLLKAKRYSSYIKNSEENAVVTLTINSVLSNLYKFEKETDKALKVNKENIFLLRKIKHNEEYYKILSHTFLGLGNAYKESKVYDSARFYYNKGIKASLQNPHKNYLYGIYRDLGDMEFDDKNYNEALKYYKNALSSPNIYVTPEVKSYIYGKIIEASIKLKDIKNISKYADSAEHYKQLISTQNKNGVEAAVSKIKNDKIKIIDEKEKRVSNLLYLLLILGILLIIITFWYFFTLKKQKKRYQEYVKQFQSQHPTQTETIIESLSASIQTSINTDLELDILEKLNSFENEEMFRDQDMSLSKLASHLNTNTNYLSRIINQHYNKNFNSYISELRINYITKKITKNPSYRNYKISFLAEDSGFVSHSAFSTKFKEVTGISPSQFLSLSSSEKQTS